jgi:hypothetical protein
MKGTLAFGTYPFTIGTTNKITNLNADLLDGATFSVLQCRHIQFGVHKNPARHL